MEEYRVMVSSMAERLLNQIYDYIAYELRSPDYAYSCIDAIRRQMSKLQYNPRRYQLFGDGREYPEGIRRMNVGNFAVFYTVVEECREVYIISVIYGKRDLTRVLQDLTNSQEGQ